MNSEERLRNAYRNPSLLTDEDIAEMRRRMAASNREWKKRKKREEDAGGFDEREVARAKRYNENYRNKTNWKRRELTADEKGKLLRAWG